MAAPQSKTAAPKLREQAYESFTERLLARQIRPGQFLSQRELVEITGMRLGAIRELIPRLESDGLVRTVPQRGMQIAHVDVELVRNAFQLRLFLEREATALFAQNAADAELARIRAAHEAIITASGSGVTEDLVEQAQRVDWDLHDTIVDALGNEIISNIYRVNSIKIRLIRQERTRISAELVQSVMSEHMAIIEALCRRDSAAAAAAVEAHIESARRRALGL